MYRNDRVVYCVCTDDEFELIVYQFDTLKELCERLGLNFFYVECALYGSHVIYYKGHRLKLYRVVLDDE